MEWLLLIINNNIGYIYIYIKIDIIRLKFIKHFLIFNIQENFIKKYCKIYTIMMDNKLSGFIRYFKKIFHT